MSYCCPQCGTRSEPPAHYVGREYRCPNCGLIGLLPPSPVAALPPDGVDDPEDDVAVFPKRKRAEAEMDMTPMVDVVFLLLIFFMITAAFGMQKSIEIPDPESDRSAQQEVMPEEREKQDEHIVVRLTRENRVFVEEEEAPTQQELLAKLREHLYQHVGRRHGDLLLIVESEATHEHVVRVLDAAAAVGMDSVRLKTE